MTVDLLDGLARYLDQLGLGHYSTTGVYGPTDVAVHFDDVPADPDRCLVLTTYGGQDGLSNEPYSVPNVQVRVRGPLGDATWTRMRAQAIYDAFQGLGRFTLPGGVRVSNIIGLQGGPIWMGRDANNRPELTVNFRVEYRNTSALHQ